jgi:hypothetical protein
MFAFASKEATDTTPKEHIEIAYWRKFNALHGWMEDLYKTKGGEEEFNCIPLQLSEDNLDNLKNDVKSKNLTQRSGFFWGSYPPDEEDYQSVLTFIEDAKKKMKEGYTIWYDSWW